MTQALTRCQGCPFKGKLVGARGPVDSPFVIVGESPGVQEAKEGQPFVGPSWTVLKHALEQHTPGSFPEPYITNAFKCFPGQGKEPATMMQAAQCCRSTLAQELKAYPRKVILALGNAALWATTGNFNLKITRCRGQLFPTEFAEIGVVASTHPAFLLRGSGSFRQFKADIEYAVSLSKGGKIRKTGNSTYELLESEGDIKDLAHHFQSLDIPYIAGDIETTGLDHTKDKILTIGLTTSPTHNYIVPEKLVHKARPLFENFAEFIWHNGKFDIKFLHRLGIPAKVHQDTMLLSYALDETRGIHGLEIVASDWLGSPNWKEALKQHIPKKGNYGDVPKPVLYKYLALDLSNTFNLFHVLRPLVANDAVSDRLYTKTLIPGVAYLAEIEKVGIRVDLQRVQENQAAFGAEAQKWADMLNSHAHEVMGRGVNPNSPAQLAEFLFDFLKLPNKPKGSRSTDADHLKELPNHPAVIALRQYRKINKGLTTYVTPALDYISRDGRVHPDYLIHGTSTGRLACRDPNLQNIPRDPRLRGQFVAESGHIILEVDLNQAELRSLACLSNDDELCRIYTTAGLSLHEEVRASIYGKPADWTDKQVELWLSQFSLGARIGPNGEDRIEEEQKMRAKAVNFGIVYGREAFSLAEEFKIPVGEAQRWINTWFERFPKAAQFITSCRLAPARGQYLKTVFGHRKRPGVVTQENLKALQNEAANFPHQSTASTVTLHAGMRLYERLPKEYNSRIINTVHDSIMIEVPFDYDTIQAVSELCINTMQQVPIDWGITRIPFVADAKAADRWGYTIKLKDFFKKAFPEKLAA